MRRMDYSRGKKKNVTENVTEVSRLLPDETAHTISRKYQLFKQVGIVEHNTMASRRPGWQACDRYAGELPDAMFDRLQTQP